MNYFLTKSRDKIFYTLCYSNSKVSMTHMNAATLQMWHFPLDAFIQREAGIKMMQNYY